MDLKYFSFLVVNNKIFTAMTTMKVFSLFAIFVFFSFSISPSHASFTFPSSELSALYDLYNATRGDSWTWKSNQTGAIWDFNQQNPNPCTEGWQGIQCTSNCTNTQCYVESLMLEGYGLDGAIPSKISDLNYLTTLQLSGNPSLKGIIQPTITTISTLENLDLSSNSLFGSIPETIEQLTNLQSLILSENFLTSTIPNGLTALSKLLVLQLDKNFFHEFLPSGLGKLSKLITFNVAVNDLQGKLPEAFCDMTSLQFVYLSFNRFDGLLPNCLNKLKEIKVFSIANNYFQGMFPRNISSWISASVFEIQNNQFTGPFPNEIGFLTNLTFLNVSKNRFRGDIPDSMQNLTKLQAVDMSGNAFSGNLSIITEHLIELQSLQLQFNAFVGTLPASISMLKELQLLDLTQNFFFGMIPDSFSNLQNLQHLTLKSNKFEGTIPSSMGSMHALLDLDLSANRLEGLVPVSLLNMSKLDTLILDINKFSGSLPIIHENISSVLRVFSLAANSINGTIPTSWGLLHNLTILSFAENSISGEIPSELGKLTKLTELRLDSNLLVGPIPSSFQYLTNLTYLDLSQNHVSGSLPDIWDSFKVLEFLGLKSNLLNDNLPESLSELTKLTELYLSDNQFDGSIPTSFFMKMIRLLKVDLGNNKFIGSLPSSFFDLRDLEEFDASNNYLSGTIDNKFDQFHGLTNLDFALNLFSGLLPTTLGLCESLQFLDVNANEISGTIPIEYFLGLPSITALDISSNQLTGNITTKAVGLWNRIRSFALDANYLTGAVPSWIFVIESIKSVYLQTNLFYGPWAIDTSSTLVTVLTDVNLCGNMLTGAIPTNINQINRLASLNISTNYFSGTLPAAIFQKVNNLEYVDISTNHFVGTLENVFTASKRLRLLFADNNEFSGQFGNIFDSNVQTRLLYVDLSNNQISGSLSPEFFIAQNMSTLALVKNCMTGSIPQEICSNRFMQSLALDGLHSDDDCQTKIFSWLPSYILRDAILGTIPSCLFAMEKLSTLHLSGNNIQGSLPVDSLIISDSLSDLSLSHNELSGSIPVAIQNHPWLNLDLSFNKFNGKLVPSIPSYNSPNQSLALNVNRLSGRVPSSLIDAVDINILNGNMFGCDIGDRSSELPKHDEDNGSYQCGSNNINIPMIIWAVITGILTILACFRHRITLLCKEDSQRMWRNFELWWSVFGQGGVKGTGGRALNTFGADLALLRRLCTSWIALLVIILIPLYCIFTVYFSTHEYTYAWVLSLAYITGRLPAIIAFAVLTTILLWVEYHIQYIYHQFLGSSNNKVADNPTPGRSWLSMFFSRPLNRESNVQDEGRSTQDEGSLSRSSRKSYFSKRSGFNTENTASFCGDLEEIEKESESGGGVRESAVDELGSMSLYSASPSISNKSSIFHSDSAFSDVTMEGHLTIATGGTKGSAAEFAPKDSIFDLRGTLAGYSIFHNPNKSEVKEKPIEDKPAEKLSSEYWFVCSVKWKWLLWSLCLVIGNIFIVLAINAFYVYAVTVSLNPIYTGIVTISVTLFKVCWSVIVVAGYICNTLDNTLDLLLKDLRHNTRKSIAKRLNMMNSSAPDAIIGEQQRRDRLQLLEDAKVRYLRLQNRYDKIVSRVLILMMLFNTVIAPLLAVLLVSPECFYYVIQKPSSVSVSYNFLQCTDGLVETSEGFYDCVGRSIATHTVSYSPAFNYSYQCTSSLLANFVNVYLYRYLISGIFMPIIFALVKRRQESLYRRYVATDINDASRASLKRWMRFWCYFMPVVARMIDTGAANPSAPDESISGQFTSDVGLNGKFSMTSSVDNPLTASMQSDSPSKSEQRPSEQNNLLDLIVMPSRGANEVFVARRFSTLLVGDLAILLTFGTIFPPLAVVIFISVMLHTVLTQVVVGRFITLAIPHKSTFAPFVTVLKRETATVGSLIALSIAPISVLATIFWSFFLFDIIGDDAGTTHSYWILLVMPILLILTRTAWLIHSSPSFQHFTCRVCNLWTKDAPNKQESASASIELRPSSYRVTTSHPAGRILSADNSIRSSTIMNSPAVIVRYDEDGDDNSIRETGTDKTHVSI